LDDADKKMTRRSPDRSFVSGLQSDADMPTSKNYSGARYSRRTANSVLLAAVAALLFPRDRVFAEEGAYHLRPFRVNIPQAKIDDIRRRVRDASWPNRFDADDWRYGTNWDYMKDLAKYWVEKFEWRKAEANLNRYPQFLAPVGDYEMRWTVVSTSGDEGRKPTRAEVRAL
jgi:hypothetical protein